MLRVLALAPLLLLLAPDAGSLTISDPGQGAVALAPGVANAHELSALAHDAGSSWLAVSDSGAGLFSLEVSVDPVSGEITSASVVAGQTLAAGSDLEGLVLLANGSVLVSDESGPAIRRHDPSDGSQLGSVSVPAVYAQARTNFSLESLALRLAPLPADDALWTANEEALLGDGPLSTNSDGTLVRLQRFDQAFAPDGQWAYETDPYPGNPFLGAERSGVADLLALSSGELLVLERSFSNQGFRHRLYRVDFGGATDTTGLASLETDPHVGVGKTLLFELSSGFANNFEGLALGPQLDAGDQSLLLVSDDSNGQSAQSLYALRIDYAPEPARPLALAAGLLALAALPCRATRATRPATANR